MKTALLVIDVQRALLNKEHRPYEADAVVQRINSLAARARAQEAPVIFIQHERASSVLEYGSENWQLERNLTTTGNDHWVRKTTPDSFLRTPLKELLESLGIDHLVVCGFSSEFCVDTTTRRAAALGYPATLAADAHTTHDKEDASATAIHIHENATRRYIHLVADNTTAPGNTCASGEE